MTDVLFSRKGMKILFTGIIFLAMGMFFGNVFGQFMLILGFGIILGFVGGEIVRYVVVEIGFILGLLSVLLVSIFFGYISSLFFGWAIGLLIGLIVLTIVIIYNISAREILKAPSYNMLIFILNI